jgi:hypothetical protein
MTTPMRAAMLDADAQEPRRAGFKVGDKSDNHVRQFSVSGPKQYQFRKQGWDDYAPTGVKLERQGENGQFFQVIGIDGNRLNYTAYTTDGVPMTMSRLKNAATPSA